MEELSQMNWPFIINVIGVLFTIIGVLLASAEFYLAFTNQNRPKEERDGQGRLRTYNLLKNLTFGNHSIKLKSLLGNETETNTGNFSTIFRYF